MQVILPQSIDISSFLLFFASFLFPSSKINFSMLNPLYVLYHYPVTRMNLLWVAGVKFFLSYYFP